MSDAMKTPVVVVSRPQPVQLGDGEVLPAFAPRICFCGPRDACIAFITQRQSGQQQLRGKTDHYSVDEESRTYALSTGWVTL